MLGINRDRNMLGMISYGGRNHPRYMYLHVPKEIIIPINTSDELNIFLVI
jgi:hypothetical protein